MPAVTTTPKAGAIPAQSKGKRPAWPALGSLPGPEERAQFGKAVRGKVPREAHAALDLPPDRPDPVDLLEKQSESRLPDLVPVRYGRMLASPFAYFRGAALPMASDLSSSPATGLTVQACGDAHLSNFGVYASPERRLVFDINDFDETLPGPWEWDVKRLAASAEIAGRDNGFAPKQRRKLVVTAVRSYREAMRSFSRMTSQQVWYARLDVEDMMAERSAAVSDRMRKTLDAQMAKARSRDSMQAVAKLTQMVDGRRRIISDPPLIVPIGELADREEGAAAFVPLIAGLLHQYRQTLYEDAGELVGRYQLADMARKVVGVGSVGTRCWIILMLGASHADPLFLQVKEAEQSVLSAYMASGAHDHQGQRVVSGQRLTQASSDVFLGWIRIDRGIDGRPHDYYVRQLRDWKMSVDIQKMQAGWMRRYLGFCGWTLARAHARTGDRFAMASYLGASDVFDEAIADFAASYADQNERDYSALAKAAKSGRITAQTGV